MASWRQQESERPLPAESYAPRCLSVAWCRTHPNCGVASTAAPAGLLACRGRSGPRKAARRPVSPALRHSARRCRAEPTQLEARPAPRARRAAGLLPPLHVRNSWRGRCGRAWCGALAPPRRPRRAQTSRPSWARAERGMPQQRRTEEEVVMWQHQQLTACSYATHGLSERRPRTRCQSTS